MRLLLLAGGSLGFEHLGLEGFELGQLEAQLRLVAGGGPLAVGRLRLEEEGPRVPQGLTSEGREGGEEGLAFRFGFVVLLPLVVARFHQLVVRGLVVRAHSALLYLRCICTEEIGSCSFEK